MALVHNFPFFSIFLPIVCAIACLTFGGKVAKWVTLSCLAVLTVMSGAVLSLTLRTKESFVYTMGYSPAPFGNEIRAGALEAFMALLFCLISLLSVSGGLRDIFRDIPDRKISFFFLMQNMLIAALLAMIYTNDIFTAYVFIEIISVSACCLIALKPGGRTLAATISYLIQSHIGSVLIFMSIAILYGVTGHLLLPNLLGSVGALAATGEYMIPLLILAALFTTGLAIKSALFPFHNWLPEAHASATTTASAVLSGLIIKCYMVLFIKLQYRVFGLDTIAILRIHHLLIAFGVIGIAYGSWQAMRQRDIKRMLSYSTIAQIGYISVAIGLNSAAGIAAACYHIAVHAVVKAMLFTAAGGLTATADGHRKDYTSLLGAARRDPLSGAAFILGGLTVTGIPPFPGFMSKLYLTMAAMDTPFTTIVILAVVLLGAVLGAMYYFPVAACILAKRDDIPGLHIAREDRRRAHTVSYRAALITFIILTLLMSVFSREILRTIEQGLTVF